MADEIPKGVRPEFHAHVMSVLGGDPPEQPASNRDRLDDLRAARGLPPFTRGGILDAVESDPQGGFGIGGATKDAIEARGASGPGPVFTNPTPGVISADEHARRQFADSVNASYGSTPEARVAGGIAFAPAAAVHALDRKGVEAATELTGVPSIMRGVDHLSHAADNPTTLGMLADGARGAGEIGLGAIPGLGALRMAARPLAALAVGSSAASVPAQAAEAQAASNNARADYVSKDPDVARLRKAETDAEARSRAAAGGSLSDEDRKLVGDLAQQRASLVDQQSKAFQRREDQRKTGEGPSFRSADQEHQALTGKLAGLDAQINTINAKSQPNPIAIKSADEALDRIRQDRSATEKAADNAFFDQATFREARPMASAALQAAGVALPALVGIRQGAVQRGLRNDTATALNTANAELPAARAAALNDPKQFPAYADKARDTLSARAAVDTPGGRTLVDAAQVPTAAVAGTGIMASPELIDYAAPPDSHRGQIAREQLKSGDYWKFKAALAAAGLGFGEAGKLAGDTLGKTVKPNLAPSDALRGKIGATATSGPTNLEAALAEAETRGINASRDVQQAATAANGTARTNEIVSKGAIDKLLADRRDEVAGRAASRDQMQDNLAADTAVNRANQTVRAGEAESAAERAATERSILNLSDQQRRALAQQAADAASKPTEVSGVIPGQGSSAKRASSTQYIPEMSDAVRPVVADKYAANAPLSRQDVINAIKAAGLAPPSANVIDTRSAKTASVLQAIKNAGGNVSRDTILNLPRNIGLLSAIGAAGAGINADGNEFYPRHPSGRFDGAPYRHGQD